MKMRRALSLVALALCSGCSIVDTIAPRPMTLTFEPSSQTVTAAHVPFGVVGGGLLTKYVCDFDLNIQAHGGKPGSVLVLSSLTYDTFYPNGATAYGSDFDMASVFGSDQLKYGAMMNGRRESWAYTPFTTRVGLKYITPDLATNNETFTLTCQ
jgi:hypothetical protein